MTAAEPLAEPVTERCTYNPWELGDMPLGAHRCPACGCVVIAGFSHGPCTDVRCRYADKGDSGRLMQDIVAMAEDKTGAPVADSFRESLVGVRLQVTDKSHPLISCLRQIEWQLNREGWCPPGRDYFPAVHGLTRVGHRLSAKDLRIPKALWAAHGSPRSAVATMCRIFETETDLFRRHLSPKFVGLAFSSEGWSVYREISDTSEILPSESDDRFELRTVYGVLVDGTIGEVSRTRGNDPEYADAISGPVFNGIVALGEWLRKVQDA